MASGAKVELTYANSGIYTANVTASNSAGTYASEVQVVVLPPNRTPAPGLTGTVQPVETPEPIRSRTPLALLTGVLRPKNGTPVFVPFVQRLHR